MAVEIADKFHINRSLVSAWMKQKDKIMEQAGNRLSEKLLKIRPSTKHAELFRGLFQLFKEARSKGRRVDFSWLWSKAKKVQKSITGNENATVCKHIIILFLKRYKIRMRAKQRNKKIAKHDLIPVMKKWHATTREKLIRTGFSEGYDEKWGRYKPRKRFNVDQSPLPFVLYRGKTYEHFEPGESQTKKVWIAQPGSGLEKRQCSLQICLRPEGECPRLAIIFRGKGRVTTEEKEAWSKDVDVFFQEKAWADTQFSLDWIKRTLEPVVKDEGDFALFCDNLSAQQNEAFQQAIAERGGVVWYGPANATDLWQPIDAGPAQLLKVLIGQEQQKWLEDDANSEMWYGHEKGITSKDRRILITHWCGKGYKKLLSGEYRDFLLKAWQKTGCLMTADGSDDDLVKPEGLEDYVIPPPALFEPSADAPTSNQNDAEARDEEEVDEEGEDDEGPTIAADDNAEDTDLGEDKEEDRDFNHRFVGRQIKAHYHSGWATGSVIYFNTNFKRFRVDFPDSEDVDYISPSEIDGIEVILL